jgi:hypothetical protein
LASVCDTMIRSEGAQTMRLTLLAAGERYASRRELTGQSFFYDHKISRHALASGSRQTAGLRPSADCA